MRLPKILYLQLAIIIILSPVEINSQRIRTRNGGKNRQLQINVDEKSLRLKKQPVSEKVTVSDEDDERKTLAQQVLDGKYGLIQTELFSSPVKRPGILSYEINPEVPKDNINNLGGLKPEEIWLAENHLLVLKGGSFSDSEQGSKMIWPPIDSYVAPQRQVKIPQNPKIPPPFPIQLKEGGPIEVIKGKNGTKNIPSYFGPPFLFQNPVNIPNKANENETKQRQGNLTQGNGGIPFPFLPPEIGLYPPAIAFLPPPGNLTELDEDDPSIYYPPRYDFVYTKNYTSFVPAGPLVPGIILPPPPNFFAPLENDTSERINPVNKQANVIQKINKSRTSGMNRVRSKLQPHGNSLKPKGLNITQEQKITPIQYTANKHQNKITLSSTLNKTNEDWVPIPAPRPFYITDISKLKMISGEDINETPLKYDIPKNGWALDNTTKQEFLADKKQPPRFKSTKGSDNIGVYLTTGISNENFIVSNSPRPTMKNVQFYESNYDDNKQLIPEEYSKITKVNNIKIVKPSLAENTTPKNHLKQYYYNKNQYKSNTLLPEVIYEDFSVTTPPVNGRVMVPNVKYEDYKNTIKGTSKPLSFLYYEQEPKYQADDGGYRYDVPETSNLNSYRQDQYRAIPPNENKITYSTTQKPPIYEYSYSAPGYGTLEAPKVGINYETTSKPIIYESNLKSTKRPQYTYFEFQTTPKQNDFNYDISNVDSLYPTVQPQVNIKNKYGNIKSFKTEEPFIAYNIQDKGQDENTKDYFISFGQKINQKDRVRTSSISQPNQQYYTKPYYENYDHTTPSPPKRTNTNIRFPDTYNIQGDTPYYTKKEYSIPKYENSNKKIKSNVPTDNYSYYYGPSNIGFQAYREYEHGVVPPNRLSSDINVNYKTPKPPINPDAEYIEQPYINLRPNHPLHGDIDVNYNIPNPTINPDAEFIDQSYIKVRPNHPLNGDIDVNYKIPNPTINPEAEFINQDYINSKPFKENSYVSYRLPGNSGHFYFLTPQTIQQPTYHERNSRLRYPEEKSQFIRRH